MGKVEGSLGAWVFEFSRILRIYALNNLSV